MASNNTCPFCEKDPIERNEKLYCVNKDCSIYLIYVPKRIWNQRARERQLEKEVMVLRKLLNEIIGK